MMQTLIEGFPSQLNRVINLGQDASLERLEKPVHTIVVAGLGGSGIGGNLVYSLIEEELRVPWIVIKGYDIPAFINENTLLIVSSFSGNTEETLSAFAQGEAQNAQILCLTSGGKVLEIAKTKGYHYLQMPQEAPSPRAFLGYSVALLLQGLYHLGFVSETFLDSLQNTAQWLQTKQANIKAKAQALSQSLCKRFAMIYAEEKLLPVITRLQQQINENAKQLCHTHVFPEMNHNELVGWEAEAENYQDKVVWIVRHSRENPRSALRIEICKPILAKKAVELIEINPEGEEWFAEVFYLIHLFDWVSFYLAEANQVDAFPVEIINYLKNELGKVPVG